MRQVSELRKDPLSRRWAIIATGRGKRPVEFKRAAHQRGEGICPFCYGNEGLTPPEVLGYRKNGGQADTPGWTVRGFPNKFPALDPGLDPVLQASGPLVFMAGGGHHEVLVETPLHDVQLPEYDPEQLALGLRAIGERMRALRATGRVRYVQVFKNEGAVAGASLVHPHFQIMGLPLVPVAVEEELETARGHAERGDGCLHCRVIEHELAAGERVVESSSEYVVHCPFASRFPYELVVHPRRHQSDFLEVDPAGLVSLATILIRATGRLARAFPRPDYNLVLHTAPFDRPHPYYHWHLEVLPRLTITAGFELGTGYFINPTAPEAACAELRALDPDWVPEQPGRVAAQEVDRQ